MNIVLLESLGISENSLEIYIKKLKALGHTFKAYERTDDINLQIERAKEADILIIANMPLKAEVIRSCKNLKFIDIAFTGYDHVDLDAAQEMNIALSNAAGYSDQSVAELTICMILSLLRKVKDVERQARSGKTKEGFIGNELCNKTVGIIGTGKIGLKSAQLCNAFGCNIIGYNGFSNKKDSDLIKYLPLKEMLTLSDIVLLHCRISNESKNLINKETIAYMKSSSILINMARGGIVNSKDLADALNANRIAGAAIDVFETEPPLEISHPLLNAKNTIITPHIAFATEESMEKRAKIVFDNIYNWLNGNQINKVL